MKSFFGFLGLSLLLVTNSFAVVITGFGTNAESGASAFTLNSPATSFPTLSQTATNFNVIGNDGGQTFAGTFNPIDTTGFATVQLTALVTGTNPNSNFTVDLFNSDFSLSRQYTGNLIVFGTANTTATLVFSGGDTSFSSVGGFVFTGGGTGDSLNITFDTLAAIPEPSTYGLVGAAMLLGFAVRAKRRQLTT